MSNPANIANLSNVTLRYESGAQALNGVSLTIARAERLCVLGANGSGKSTLASVLCGLLAPDEGVVSLVGNDVFDSSRQNPIDFRAYKHARHHVGLVFQNPDDQIVTTVVEEDVAFGPENLGVSPSEIGRRVERELHRVALTDYAKANPTKLSGGQKQRVAIAGTLAMEPDLLVFDEPGSLLDVRGRTSIMRVMDRLRDLGTTIVHITHFMEEALEADRVIVLDRGHIVLAGSPSEVFAHEGLLDKLGLEKPFEARLMHHITQGIPVQTSGVKPPPSKKQSLKEALRAEHVCFAYNRERRALDDVSFSVAQGESLAIIGQTGSGKSTLLRLLCALEAPDEGLITVGDVCTKRKRDRRRLHGTIGYVMQHPERQLFAETVFADVAFGPKNLGLPQGEVDRRCHAALAQVGLTGLDDASPFELSGGQQRLCALAGILAMKPRILALDEPTAGLDPLRRNELRAILHSIHAQGVTLIEITHSMEDAAQAEHVLVLDQSRILLEGTPAEVFCFEHEAVLTKAGLGLPQPLLWARRLEKEGYPPLGSPLTLANLVKSALKYRDEA